VKGQNGKRGKSTGRGEEGRPVEKLLDTLLIQV